MARQLELMNRIREIHKPLLVSSDSSIEFPDWVEPPTPCKTRTFSIVLPNYTRHGAMRLEMAFKNRPTILAPRIGLPGLYTKWAS